MNGERFIEEFAKELVKVVGVQAAFGILMKSYEGLNTGQKEDNQELFLDIMGTLKKLDVRQASLKRS